MLVDKLIDDFRGGLRLSSGNDMPERFTETLKFIMASYAQDALHDSKIAEESRVVVEEWNSGHLKNFPLLEKDKNNGYS
jgi:hypothetical protein